MEKRVQIFLNMVVEPRMNYQQVLVQSQKEDQLGGC
jgi:hypothetical protein